MSGNCFGRLCRYFSFECSPCYAFDGSGLSLCQKPEQVRFASRCDHIRTLFHHSNNLFANGAAILLVELEQSPLFVTGTSLQRSERTGAFRCDSGNILDQLFEEAWLTFEMASRSFLRVLIVSERRWSCLKNSNVAFDNHQ